MFFNTIFLPLFGVPCAPVSIVIGKAQRQQRHERHALQPSQAFLRIDFLRQGREQR